MAEIIENVHGRRLIRVTTNDVISLVKTYQTIACESESYSQIREKLDKADLYIPEDVQLITVYYVAII